MGICIGWLNSHIMIEDRAIIKKDTKWVNSSSQSELEALEDTIIQAEGTVFFLNCLTQKTKYPFPPVPKSILYTGYSLSTVHWCENEF